MTEVFEDNIWDINSRSQTSAFSWRGQFTPDLVSLIFDKFDPRIGLVFDPFMGSGTVLLEALKRDRPACGSEINPAAFYLSKVFTLAHLSKSDRIKLLHKIDLQMGKLKVDGEGNCFDSLVDSILKSKDELTQTLLTALLLLGAKDSAKLSLDSTQKAFLQITNVLNSLPETKTQIQVTCSDARAINLKDNSVGFVVTSPPYINVFNYHQNYRPSVEALGWNVLEKAQSEIGSNRKHRGNRLLTVIQYALDIALFLEQLSRVLIKDGVVVMVVGRESKVRGLNFMNSEIIENMVNHFSVFKIIEKHERKFRSRYGALVYEDILIFTKTGSINQVKHDSELICADARSIAISHLERQRENCPADVVIDLNQAILQAEFVLPSPIR